MKQRLENLGSFLSGVLIGLCILRFVSLLIAYRGVFDLFFAYFGWEAWLEFGTGIIAIITLILLVVLAFVKSDVPVKVEGVHDGA